MPDVEVRRRLDVDLLFRSKPVQSAPVRSAREDAVEIEIAKVKAELELAIGKSSTVPDTSFVGGKGKAHLNDAFKPTLDFPEPSSTGALYVLRFRFSATLNFVSFSRREVAL